MRKEFLLPPNLRNGVSVVEPEPVTLARAEETVQGSNTQRIPAKSASTLTVLKGSIRIPYTVPDGNTSGFVERVESPIICNQATFCGGHYQSGTGNYQLCFSFLPPDFCLDGNGVFTPMGIITGVNFPAHTLRFGRCKPTFFVAVTNDTGVIVATEVINYAIILANVHEP